MRATKRIISDLSITIIVIFKKSELNFLLPRCTRTSCHVHFRFQIHFESASKGVQTFLSEGHPENDIFTRIRPPA